jgi:hypothetical protein
MTSTMQNTFTRRDYFWWIAICSIPVLIKAIETLFLSIEYDTTDPGVQTSFISWDIILPVAYYILLTIVQQRVLRRFALQLSLWRWGATVIASYVLFTLSYVIASNYLQFQQSDWDQNVRILSDAIGGQASAIEMMPPAPVDWTQLMHFLVCGSACFVLLPAYVLSKRSMLKLSQLFNAGIATALGSFAAAVLLRAATSTLSIMLPDGCEPSLLAPVVNTLTDSFAWALGATLGCFTLANSLSSTTTETVTQFEG